MKRLSTIGLLCGALLGLSGCYVAPGRGYGYYRPPVATGVYVAPRAYYPAYRPYGYGAYGYGRYGYYR